jgi:signal transduction histidine kinase/ligand-binding sensor domain-containing protein
VTLRPALYALVFWVASLYAISVEAGSGDSLKSRAQLRVVGPRASVRAVIEDQRHYIWTAGDRGACRFDGLTWLCPVTSPSSLLGADNDGGVWVATNAGELGYIAAGALRAQLYSVPHAITALAIDGRRRIWIGTPLGLFSFDRVQGRQATVPVFGTAVAALVVESSGDVLVATEDRIARIGGDAPRTIWQASAPVRTVTELNPGNIIAATTDESVWQLSGSAIKLKATRLPIPPYPSLGPIAVDGEGQLWIGDRDALLFLGPNEPRTTPWAFNLGTSVFQVNAIVPDHEKSLWIGTEIGLLQIRFAQVVRPVEMDRVKGRNDIVFSVTQARDGAIWMATAAGVSRWDGQKVREYDNCSGLGNPDIRSVVGATDGTIWAAGMQSGVFREREDHFVPVTDAVGNRAPGAIAMRPRREGGVWVAMLEGGVGVVNENRFETVLPPFANGRDRVVDLLEDGKGTLWLATERDGLLSLRDGKVLRYGSSAGIPGVALLCLLEDDDGSLWIGTDGAGLLRFDGTRATAFRIHHGVGENRVYSMVGDPYHNLWLGSPHGISVASRDALNRVASGNSDELSVTLFGSEDGVVGEPIQHFAPLNVRTDTGALLFATAEGLVEVSPSLLQKPRAPKVFVDGIVVNDQRMPLTHRLQMTADDRADLVVDFSAPTFVSPQRLLFRYKIEGLDRDWSETKAGRLRVDRLPHGHYRLLLQAFVAATDPSESEVTTLEIALLAPWYRRTAVHLLAVVVLLLVVAFVARMLKRRNEQVQAAILAERARIAHEIHDGLEQDLSGLRLQIEAAGHALVRSPETARANIERAGALIGDASSDLRMAIWKLQLDVTTTEELFRDLEKRLRRFTDGTHLEFAARSVGPTRNLKVGMATHLVAVAREAVTNAVKHGSATEITFVLDTTARHEVVMEIADNGVGGAAVRPVGEAMSSGLGISGMKARARAMAGRLEIESQATAGTRIRLFVPLR